MPTKKGCVWAMLKHRLRKTKHKPWTVALELCHGLGIAMINQQESTL